MGVWQRNWARRIGSVIFIACMLLEKHISSWQGHCFPLDFVTTAASKPLENQPLQAVRSHSNHHFLNVFKGCFHFSRTLEINYVKKLGFYLFCHPSAQLIPPKENGMGPSLLWWEKLSEKKTELENDTFLGGEIPFRREKEGTADCSIPKPSFLLVTGL